MSGLRVLVKYQCRLGMARTFSSSALQAFFSMAVCTRFGFVTSRSSPTTCARTVPGLLSESWPEFLALTCVLCFYIHPGSWRSLPRRQAYWACKYAVHAYTIYVPSIRLRSAKAAGTWACK